MSARLLQQWERVCRRHARRSAVVQAGDGARVTFGELDARAAAWAAAHVPKSLAIQGRPAVFSAPNGIAWFEIFLGLLRAGALVVPLDAAEPRAGQYRLATALRAACWWDGVKLETLQDSQHYRDPALCLIKLTSGTTGAPRPLVFTADQLLADGAQVTSTMGIRSRDLNYALIPLGHSYGLGNLAIPLLAHGVPLVCGTAPLPHAIASDFARWQPTVFPGVPALWRALAASDVAMPGLRLGISAGAPLPPNVARDFLAHFGQRIHNFYGSSETGGITYDRTGEGALAGHVGRPMRGVTVVEGRKRDLSVCSAAVFTFGNRRRKKSFGVWRMPDLAAVDSRRHVSLLGRRGTTVKIAGRRVDLGEVAALLRRIPGVHDAWAGISAGNEPLLNAVVATELEEAELRAGLVGEIAAWKVPRKIFVVPVLPLTVRGKMDTRALQAIMG